jgi:hypothetical protein
LNYATEKSYTKEHIVGHAEIGAEYSQFRTWFDIDFMPYSPTRKDTKWFAYGATWMFGYKLLRVNSLFNIIPSIGPGFELLNIRSSPYDKIESSLGPALNLELELRLQGPQLSVGIYGGSKFIRHDDYENISNVADKYQGDVNFDKMFVGLKFTWTMLSTFQKREKDME